MNGGFSIFVEVTNLENILGHATLVMVKNYLVLVNADLQKNHPIASPVDHWQL